MSAKAAGPVTTRDRQERRFLEIGGKRLPFLRWSLLRMVVGAYHFTTHWQVGDGREEALAAYVEQSSGKGDLDDIINAIDDFCYHRSIMVNVGDEKGPILERAIRRAQPLRLLELGTYCGYSALRSIRAMPQNARLWSIEFNPANANVARRIWDHAGVADQATVVVGTLGDQGQTIARLEAEHGFAPGTLDLVFIDHDKDAYLPDLERILDRRWLHPGSVVVADNMGFPGSPAYRKYMTREQGKSWRTIEHRAHAEYQTLVKDLVLESEYLHD
jgi:catechol O-methyltransferase